MDETPDIQAHMNAEIARLVMELATAKAVIAMLQRQIAAVTPPPEAPAA